MGVWLSKMRIESPEGRDITPGEKGHHAVVTAIVMACGGFVKGFLVMDLSFDLPLAFEQATTPQGEKAMISSATAAAFSYYRSLPFLLSPLALTPLICRNIQNSALVIPATCGVISLLVGASSYLIAHAPAESSSDQSGISKAYRRIFQLICGTLSLYLIGIVPRYVPFMGLAAGTKVDPRLLAGWSRVFISRALITVGAVVIQRYCHRALSLLVQSDAKGKRLA